MAPGIPARLTPAEGRKFGFTVGAAFLVLAAISYWRGHVLPPRVLGGLGGLLLLGGLVMPARLGPVQRAWMGLAHAISKVTTPIFMGIVYFGVLTPIGVFMRLIGKNPMERHRYAATTWLARSTRRSDLERQF